MKTVIVLIGGLVLFLMGITVGGQLWLDDAIPPWLIPLFLLPAAVVFDHFLRPQRSSWKILKYSTTIGIFCLTPVGYFVDVSEVSLFLIVGISLLILYCLGEILVCELCIGIFGRITKKLVKQNP